MSRLAGLFVLGVVACTTSAPPGSAGEASTHGPKQAEPAPEPAPMTAVVHEPPPPPEPPRSLVVALGQFSDACQNDEDCVRATAEPCDECGCTESAIAATDEDAYRAAASAVECPPRSGKKCRCRSLDPWCDAGTCKAR